MITTVLFDFGGVVIRTPFELLEVEWKGPFDTSTDPLWVAFQSGEMSEREYWHTRASSVYPGAVDPVGAMMRTLYDTEESVIVRPEVVALLDELGDRGLEVAVLTNDLSAFHEDDWIDRMTVIRRLHPVIDLSHVGFLKPAPQAYEHALRVLAKDPEQVVFVDDQPGNVEGARRAGLEAIWFDPTQVELSIGRVLAAVA